MNTYPRDEFDAVPEAPRRQGVHRTREEGSPDDGASPSGRGLRWILAAGILALVIGAVSFFVLPRLGLSAQPAAASAATSSAASSAPGTAAPSASAQGKPSASPSEAPSSAAPSAPTASAGADPSLEVGVYNATSTAGLGNRVAATARSAGWSVSTVGNWSGAPVDGPVVYYRSAADAASAQALAAAVGVRTVLEAPALGLPLAVVIGPGYTG